MFLKGVGSQGLVGKPHAFPEDSQDSLNAFNIRLNRCVGWNFQNYRVSIKQHYWKSNPKFGSHTYREILDYIVLKCNEVNIDVYFAFHHGAGEEVLLGELLKNHNYLGWLDSTREICERYNSFSCFKGLQNWVEPTWVPGESDIARLEKNFAAFQKSFVDTCHSFGVTAFVPSPGHFRYKHVSPFWVNNPLPEPVIYTWQEYFTHAQGRAFMKRYAEGKFIEAKVLLKQYIISKSKVDKGLNSCLSEFGFHRDLTELTNEVKIALDLYDVLVELNIPFSQWCYGDWNSPWRLHKQTSVRNSVLERSGQLLADQSAPLPPTPEPEPQPEEPEVTITLPKDFWEQLSLLMKYWF